MLSLGAALVVSLLAAVHAQGQCSLATSSGTCAKLGDCHWCAIGGAQAFCAPADEPCPGSGQQLLSAPSISAVFDCADGGPAVWIELKNHALNPLRVELCASDPNNASQGACSGSDPTKPKHYTICTPAAGSTSSTQGWINANTTVALRVPGNTTYVVFVYCVELAGQSIHCLNSPVPPELYGPTDKGGHFPKVFATPAANASYCSEDKDCGTGNACTNGSCPPAAFARGPRIVITDAPRRAAIAPRADASSSSSSSCGWQAYPGLAMACDYARLSTATSDDCRAHCCSAGSSLCVAATFYAASSMCFLHAPGVYNGQVAESTTVSSPATTVHRLRVRTACGVTAKTTSPTGMGEGVGALPYCGPSTLVPNWINSTTDECTRAAYEMTGILNATCTTGLQCGCACISDSDCEQDQLDVGCSVCSTAATRGNVLTGVCARPAGADVGGDPYVIVNETSAVCKAPVDGGMNEAASRGVDIVFLLSFNGTSFEALESSMRAQRSVVFDAVGNLTSGDDEHARFGVIYKTSCRIYGDYIPLVIACPHTDDRSPYNPATYGIIQPLTSDNGTLAHALTLNPAYNNDGGLPSKFNRGKDGSGIVEALSAITFDTPSRRKYLVAMVHDGDVELTKCLQADAVTAARGLWSEGVTVIAAELGGTATSGATSNASMLASPPLADHTARLDTVVAKLVADIVKTAPAASPAPISSMCGRRCATASHCGGSCAVCETKTGTCTNAAARNCSVPIPSGVPNLNLSFGLDMVFVIDGVHSTKDSVSAAMEIASQFTMGDTTAGLARFGIITYTDKVNVLMPLTDSNNTWSNTPCLPLVNPCNGPCEYMCNTGIMAAMTRAATMLNGTANGGRFFSGARFRDDTQEESFQVVVVIGANLQTSGSNIENDPFSCAGPVCSSRRDLWAQGAHVFAVQLENNTFVLVLFVIALFHAHTNLLARAMFCHRSDDPPPPRSLYFFSCTFPANPSPGTVPGYECNAAPLMATDNTSFFTLAASTSSTSKDSVATSSTSAPISAAIIAASVVSTIEASRKHQTCDWQEYDSREIVLDYKTSLKPSSGACVAACCNEYRCKAVTINSAADVSLTAGAVECRFHNEYQMFFSLPAAKTKQVQRKVDVAGCARRCLTNLHCQLTGCPSCNVCVLSFCLRLLFTLRCRSPRKLFYFLTLFVPHPSTPPPAHVRLFQKCEAGYKCGCVCSSNHDCDQSSLNIGCSQCHEIDPVTSFGRCRSPTCGQSCTRDADCANAPSCTKCSSLPGSTTGAKACSAPSPDAIPGDCVAPFPGQPHKNCSATLDLMLLLDGSGSIQHAAWNDIMRCEL